MSTPSHSSAEHDPLFGNRASHLLGAAVSPSTHGSAASGWQPPSCDQLQAWLHGYEVHEFVARGGMGAVYRGVQLSLGRQVAIKILPPELVETDPHYAERFKQEARAMGQLNHPGIVAVYDFGEMQDGTLYFIMEFIEGTDVAQMVASQGRLPSAHAMAIAAHVCDALQYAHQRGVVHRDIKPANIMVGYDGRVKVADFGLAKQLRHTGASLTQSGYVMGTPHFVAPEALTLGVAVDHRADIYAVGVMLYQMLTGKVPQGVFEMPSLQVPGLDPRYDQIVANAMREDRDRRYQQIQDMRRALDAIMTQPVMKSEVLPQTLLAPRASPRVKPQQSVRQPRVPSTAGTPSRKRQSPVPFIITTIGVVAFGVALTAWPKFSTTKERKEDLASPLAGVKAVDSTAKPRPIETSNPASNVAQLSLGNPPRDTKLTISDGTVEVVQPITAIGPKPNPSLAKPILLANTVPAPAVVQVVDQGTTSDSSAARVDEVVSTIPEASQSTSLLHVCVFGLDRLEATKVLGDPHLKTEPQIVLAELWSKVVSKRVSILSNPCVSAKLGKRTRVEGAYGCESEVNAQPDGSWNAMMSIYLPGTNDPAKLVVTNITTRRGGTRFLGSFEEGKRDPKTPFRLVFVTFQ